MKCAGAGDLSRLAVGALLLAGAGRTALAADVLSRHPSSPHCFLYGGKPIVLVTATEHYGAVLNRDFQSAPYLDELARNRLNLTRAFTFYRELDVTLPELGFANTLAPRSGREALPWRRTGPGRAGDGDLKFDLNRWNPDYFDRFRQFVAAAAARGIIVEVTLFCNPYNERTYSLFPTSADSNINGVGKGITSFRQFTEEHDPTVLAAQKKFVQKMVEELNEFDNVYFEILNEGHASTRDEAARLNKWQLALCDVIRETERRLPKQHCIAVNAHQQVTAYTDGGERYVEIGDAPYFDDHRVDILNYHYLSRRSPGRGVAARYPVEPREGRVGNIWQFLRSRRNVRKPIVFDENWAGVVRGKDTNWDRNRLEAWETILAGGSGFDHLDWSFLPDDPQGAGAGRIADGRRLDARNLRAQLALLGALWNQLDPSRMERDEDLVLAAPASCLAFASRRDDGGAAVVYLADKRPNDGGFGAPVGGEVRLRLRQGRYLMRVAHSGAVQWSDGGTIAATLPDTRLPVPEFRQDCALVLTAQ